MFIIDLIAIFIIYLNIVTIELNNTLNIDDPMITLNNEDKVLTAVNKSDPLDKTYIPTSLSTIQTIRVHTKVVKALQSMLNQAQKDEVNLVLLSGYRSFEDQGRIFENYASEYGVLGANTFSAMPGYSEHQLGTTIDFGTKNKVINFSPQFAESSQGKWLKENAHLYGFVQSYPSGSENITGYIYEPWHYRYVGKENADILYKTNIPLQEYQNQITKSLSTAVVGLQLVSGRRVSLQ